MKLTTAIITASTLLAAWVAMPSAADDVTDDTGEATVVRNDPATPELQRTQKPGATPAPEAQEPKEHADLITPSATTGTVKTLVAADPRTRARATKGAAGSDRTRRASRIGRAADAGGKRPRVSISRKAVGKRTAAPLVQKLTASGSQRPVSPRAGKRKMPRRTLRLAGPMKSRRKTVSSTKIKPQVPFIRPPLVAPPPQQSPAPARQDARQDARQATAAPRPIVTTPPRRQQPARQPRVIEPAPPLNEWEKYVAKTSAMYQFTDAQDAKARSILTDLEHRAKQYRLTRGPAFLDAERLQDKDARAARLRQLNRPIDKLFDELKQRLDNLPTIPQKLQAKRHAA